MSIITSIKFRLSKLLSKTKRLISLDNLSDLETVLIWAAKSPRRSSLYYFLFNKSFDREHYSVLNGKLIHKKHDLSGISHDSTLRRNIHRIEKGLTTIPLKNSFAQEYIDETIYSYKNVVKMYSDFNTIKWATDVLELYFRTVLHSEIISKAYSEFSESRVISKDNAESYVPYYRKDSVKSNLDYNSFHNLCLQRRSVRWYKTDKVPFDLVHKAVSSSLLSPSACNRQPYRFVFIEDPELLKVAGDLPMGVRTFSHNIPLMAILVGDLSAYFDERDRHIIYIDGGLAAMSFMYALETLGLASCPINWPDIEEREKRLDKFLNLKPHERGIMFISIGFPLEEGQIAFSQKKSVKGILSYR